MSDNITPLCTYLYYTFSNAFFCNVACKFHFQCDIQIKYKARHIHVRDVCFIRDTGAEYDVLFGGEAYTWGSKTISIRYLEVSLSLETSTQILIYPLRKHPHYLNGRLIFLICSQLTVAMGFMLRNIMLDRSVFLWASSSVFKLLLHHFCS